MKKIAAALLVLIFPLVATGWDQTKIQDRGKLKYVPLLPCRANIRPAVFFSLWRESGSSS